MFILWCILFILCWPVAITALVLYPVIWLISLPLRAVGVGLTALFDLVGAVISLPFRFLRFVLGGPFALATR